MDFPCPHCGWAPADRLDPFRSSDIKVEIEMWDYDQGAKRTIALYKLTNLHPSRVFSDVRFKLNYFDTDSHVPFSPSEYKIYKAAPKEISASAVFPHNATPHYAEAVTSSKNLTSYIAFETIYLPDLKPDSSLWLAVRCEGHPDIRNTLSGKDYDREITKNE